VIDYGRKPSGVPVISLIAFLSVPFSASTTPAPIPVGENTLLLSLSVTFLEDADYYYV